MTKYPAKHHMGGKGSIWLTVSESMTHHAGEVMTDCDGRSMLWLFFTWWESSRLQPAMCISFETSFLRNQMPHNFPR